MTEPLFLALLIWIDLLTVECVRRHSARAARDRVRRRLIGLGLLILAAVFTRYDGWILGAAAWCMVAWHLWRARDFARRVAPAFHIFTLLAVAGPLLWLWYNQHFFHDPLDFMRGPYSAPAIEKKTSPPGSRHYRGWHNPGWALLFYTRTAQVDAAVWETGFALMLAALCGTWARDSAAAGRPSRSAAVDAAAFLRLLRRYGSVPIFIPQLWPHSFYNSRYGMELLPPALAVFATVAVAEVESHWLRREPGGQRSRVVWVYPVALGLVVLNPLGMIFGTAVAQQTVKLFRHRPSTIFAITILRWY